MRRAKIIGTAVLSLVLAVPMAGLGYQYFGSALDAEIRRSPIGRMVDVNGQKLHLDCRGNGTNTLVLEAGGMSFSANWALIQEKLAHTHRVCSYDRPGLGWSDNASPPTSPSARWALLLALLKNAGEQAPYVLVGHSLGGALIRAYAAQDDTNLAGLVFIDSGPAGPYSGMSENLRAHFKEGEQVSWFLPALTRLGVMRFNTIGLDLGEDFPDNKREVIKAFLANVEHVKAGAAEFRRADEFAQAGEILIQTTVPVLAIIGRYDHNDVEGHIDSGLAYHRKLADLNTQNSRLLILEDAGHFDLLGTERYISQVVSTIDEFIATSDGN